MIKFIDEYMSLIIFSGIFIFFLIIDFLLRKKNSKLKKEINKKYSKEELENLENLENLDTFEQDLFVKYYKRKNIINLLRFTLIFGLSISLILYKNPGIFSFVAIAVGAVIVIFKEPILSFISFFYISTHYKIGDNISIGDVKGEIIYINIFNVGLIGKNENIEHNGQFYYIPNYKLIIEIIKKEDLSLNKYIKEDIDIYYNRNLFESDFEYFLSELEKFLSSKLDKNNINNVGNYKSYIGYKYKIRFKYEKDYLIITVSFIEKPRIILDLKKNVILFIETHKKKY